LARTGEIHGQDYYFLSRSAIAALPAADFYIGPVREMLQAVDLKQLEMDVKSHDLVLVDIFAGLWPGLETRIRERLGPELRTASVFMTAVDPNAVGSQPDDETRARFIQDAVERNLRWRAKDSADKIRLRAKSAVAEITEALGPSGAALYERVFHSSPEGPDREDEWTKEAQPTGRAKDILNEFVVWLQSTRPSVCNRKDR
jgi:hypothetical protein